MSAASAPVRSGIDRTARASDHYPIWAVLTWDVAP